MPKYLPSKRTVRTPRVPVARTVHYPDPAAQPLVFASPADYAAYLVDREREQRLAYDRWARRQAAIIERDRKIRRFWLGFGAVVALVVLTGLALLAWLVWHIATVTGLGLLIVPLVALAVAAVVAGGHRCITVVQHWH